jgi:hypothetical protein
MDAMARMAANEALAIKWVMFMLSFVIDGLPCGIGQTINA